MSILRAITWTEVGSSAIACSNLLRTAVVPATAFPFRPVSFPATETVGTGVGDGVGVGVGVGSGVGTGVGAAVGSGVGTGLAVGCGVAEGAGLAVGVGAAVGVGVGVGSGVGATVGDGDGVGEGVGSAVGDGVGVAHGVLLAAFTSSCFWLASKRRTVFCPLLFLTDVKKTSLWAVAETVPF